ncbi:MAG: IS91 family transposase [Daejeonella sp.]
METMMAPSTGLREVFASFGSNYRLEHKLPEQQLKAMYAIQHCRTAVLGGRVDTCDHCGHKRIVYNSCRNRHCPLCQGMKQLQWVDKLNATLLPVSYFHLVFTIPSELNRLALVNQRCLYDILFKAASESLLLLSRDEKYLNVQSGLVAILHTWGQNLMDHPHLHTIVPSGGWCQTAQCWRHSSKKFFIPVKVISAVFKGKFLALLKLAYQQNQLKFEGQIKPLYLKGNFKTLLNLLYAKDWVVYAKKPFKNSTHIINYLGRYSHRVAISNDRIAGIEGDQVIFRWKDYKELERMKTMKLPAAEFIRRFLLHVLPKGFCKIRYYGIFASRNRNEVLLKCKKILAYSTSKSKLTGLSWQDALLVITGMDVLKCPVCKKGNMVTTELLIGNRAPPGSVAIFVP